MGRLLLALFVGPGPLCLTVAKSELPGWCRAAEQVCVMECTYGPIYIWKCSPLFISRISDKGCEYIFTFFLKLSRLIGGDVVAQKDIHFNRLKPNMN